MKSKNRRLFLDLLEDRNAPGNALSILSMLPDTSRMSPVLSSNDDAPPPPPGKSKSTTDLFTKVTPEYTNTKRELGITGTHPARSDRQTSSVGLDLKLTGFGKFNDPGLPAKQALRTNQNSQAGSEVRDAQAFAQQFDSGLTTAVAFSSGFNGADRSIDALASIMMQTGVQRRSRTMPNPEPVLAIGGIGISPTTQPAGANPEQLLPEGDKLHPGWFSNVNWSDDDNDGWNPATTKETTADPTATYTPDKDDSAIAGGDRDLRKFVVSVTDANNTPNPNYAFKLTFGSSVKVYFENTKSGGPATSGDTYGNNHPRMTISSIPGGTASTGQVTFWLEGFTASTAFKDVELKAEYIGVNIPMNKWTDTVNVTVFGVTQEGIFSGDQQDDNIERHSDYAGSFDENGQISWDLPSYINWENEDGITYCKYFHDCMEMQGTVSPPRDALDSIYYGHADDPRDYPPPPQPAPVPLVTFLQFREAFARFWMTGGSYGSSWVDATPGHLTPGSWSPDNGLGAANNPTMSDHIYYIDGPGVNTRMLSSFWYAQFYANFRNATKVSFYGDSFMCSDFSRWHSQIFIKPKLESPPIYVTRDEEFHQLLGRVDIDLA